MGILRRCLTANFTSISNVSFEDDRLSIEAKGTLAYLLTRHHNWTIHTSQIGNKLGMGKDKTSRVFKELISAGYVRRTAIKGANGQWDGYDYVVDCERGEQGVASLPQPEKPAPVKPAPEKPAPENTPPILKTESEQRRKGNKDEESDSSLPLFDDTHDELWDGMFDRTKEQNPKAIKKFIDDAFEQFWRVMPKRVAKGAARKAWATAVKKAPPQVIIAAAVAYAKSRVGQERQYDKTPGPWLNDERWLDAPPEPSASPTVRRVTDGII